MHIKGKLLKVAELFRRSRRAGHTTAQATGYIGDPNVIVLVEEGTCPRLRQRRTLNSNLEGIRSPIVVEHFLVQKLCEESLQYIGHLEEQLHKQHCKLLKLKAMIIDL